MEIQSEVLTTKEEKKLKLFRAMERQDEYASNAWMKLRRTETRWENAKERLQKKGLWNEYCDKKGWSRQANFHDIGA